MKNKKLKPCPFCGEKEDLEGDCRVTDGNTPYIICRNCGACSPDSGEHNWNTRHSPSLDEIRKAIENSMPCYTADYVKEAPAFQDAVNKVLKALLPYLQDKTSSLDKE